MHARPLEHRLATLNRDGLGKTNQRGGKVVGVSNGGQWVKQRRGAVGEEEC